MRRARCPSVGPSCVPSKFAVFRPCPAVKLQVTSPTRSYRCTQNRNDDVDKVTTLGRLLAGGFDLVRPQTKQYIHEFSAFNNRFEKYANYYISKMQMQIFVKSYPMIQQLCTSAHGLSNYFFRCTIYRCKHTLLKLWTPAEPRYAHKSADGMTDFPARCGTIYTRSWYGQAKWWGRSRFTPNLSNKKDPGAFRTMGWMWIPG